MVVLFEVIYSLQWLLPSQNLEVSLPKKNAFAQSTGTCILSLQLPRMVVYAERHNTHEKKPEDTRTHAQTHTHTHTHMYRHTTYRFTFLGSYLGSTHKNYNYGRDEHPLGQIDQYF